MQRYPKPGENTDMLRQMYRSELLQAVLKQNLGDLAGDVLSGNASRYIYMMKQALGFSSLKS